jgi:methylmalonyl-CoA/ethylmalonyl-CoA epimerase
MKLHHLGVACEDISAALGFIAQSQTILSQSGIVFDPLQNASLCMVQLADGTVIELISGPKVENLVKRRLFLYHTCWETADFDRQLSSLCENGCLLVSPPKPALLFNEKRVAFLNSPLGLIELLEA